MDDANRDLIMTGNAFLPLGKGPDELYYFLKMDDEKRVFATLDDETLDRIAVRVADLLYARNRSGER